MTTCKKILVKAAFLLGFSLFFGDLFAQSLRANLSSQKSLEPFDIAAEPAVGDWRHFMALGIGELKELWSYQAARGKNFSSWNWAWRLGWIRSCAQFSKDEFCSQRLQDGLADAALLVRGEAAVQLGNIFSGTHDESTIDALGAAFKNLRKNRKVTAHTVRQKILYAIYQIGGDHAAATARIVTKTDITAREYWKKISKI